MIVIIKAISPFPLITTYCVLQILLSEIQCCINKFSILKKNLSIAILNASNYVITNLIILVVITA